MRTRNPARASRTHVPLPVFLGVLCLAGCGGGGGGGGGGPVAEPELAFVANGNDSAVSRLETDAATGGLVHDGYQVLGTLSLEAVALHPSGDTLYAVGETTLHALRIDGPSGALTPIDQGPTPAGAANIVIHPELSVAYVSRRSSGTITVFAIDPMTGEFEELASVATPDPVDIDLDPTGSHLFAVNRTQRTVRRHAVLGDGTLGTGTVVRTEPQFQTTSLAFHPAGDRAYLTIDSQSANVLVFSVDPAGNFALLDSEGAGNGPVAIEVDAAGAFAYVGNAGNDTVSALAIDPASGLLDFISSDPTVEDPFTIAFSPDGTRLLVGSVSSSELDLLDIETDGSLTPGGRTRTRGPVRGLAVRAGVGTVAARAERIYVPYAADTAAGTIQRFGRDPGTGALVAPWAVPTGDEPRQVAFHPNGRFAYSANGESADVEAFSVDPATGNLASVQVVSILPHAVPNDGTDWIVRAAVEPSGRFLYVLDNRTTLGLSGRIFWFSIAEDGLLAFGGSITTGWNPENFVIHPSGKYLYVMASWGDQIQTFEIAAATGALTIKNTLGGYDRPVQCVIPASGRYLYVAVENEDSVVRFSLQASNGFPVAPQAYQKALPSAARGMALHPSGERLFLMSADDTVASFSVDSVSGTLAYVSQTSSGFAEWLSVTADGRHAYGVAPNGIQVFAIDPATLAVTHTGQWELPGVGVYQRSLTLQ